MRKIYSLVILALIFFSCSKEETPEFPTQKNYPVKFTTQLNFEEIVNTRSSDSIKNPGDSIKNPNDSNNGSIFYHYLVYESSGNIIKHLKGSGSSINDSLPLGLYYISIIGSNNVNLISYNINPGNYFTDSFDYPNAFYSTFSYSVDSIFTEKNVKLESIWGEIEVDITDKATCYIPNNVKSMTISTKGIAPSFFVQNGNGKFVSNSLNLASKTISEFRNDTISGNITSFSTQNNKIDVNLLVSFNDSTSKSILLKSVEVKKGTKTILRGVLGNTLKTESKNQDLKLILDEELSSEVITF